MWRRSGRSAAFPGPPHAGPGELPVVDKVLCGGSDVKLVEGLAKATAIATLRRCGEPQQASAKIEPCNPLVGISDRMVRLVDDDEVRFGLVAARERLDRCDLDRRVSVLAVVLREDDAHLRRGETPSDELVEALLHDLARVGEKENATTCSDLALDDVNGDDRLAAARGKADEKSASAGPETARDLADRDALAGPQLALGYG